KFNNAVPMRFGRPVLVLLPFLDSRVSAIPNTQSRVGIRQLKRWFDVQQVLKSSPLALVWQTRIVFPVAKTGYGNPHSRGQFMLQKALFETFGQDDVAEGFQGCRKRLSRPTITRNMASRHLYGPVCNTRQCYSPSGRGKSVQRLVSFHVRGQAPRSNHPRSEGPLS